MGQPEEAGPADRGRLTLLAPVLRQSEGWRRGLPRSPEHQVLHLHKNVVKQYPSLLPGQFQRARLSWVCSEQGFFIQLRQMKWSFLIPSTLTSQDVDSTPSLLQWICTCWTLDTQSQQDPETREGSDVFICASGLSRHHSSNMLSIQDGGGGKA